MKRSLLIAMLMLCPNTSFGQGIEHIKAHYTKYEYRIPMRDGKKLFTSVYVPKDESKKYPIMLTRTPYNVKPYGVDQYKSDLGPSPLFGKAGYIFVYQDVRGRWMSEGEHENMRAYIVDKNKTAFDETSDTYDTIDWLIKNVAGHNGRVGQWGISYPGFYTVCGMIDAHPALKAASPQAPVTDWFVGDDFHHNGALFLPHLFNFISNFGQPRPEPTKKDVIKFEHSTPDGYDFFLKIGPLANTNSKHLKGNIAFWNDVMAHPNYDTFWQSKNIRQHVKNIKPAVLTVGGWFDAENLFGAIETYRNSEVNGARSANHLIMGPWLHGGWSHLDGDSLGDVKFNAKTAVFYRESIEFPWFEHILKDAPDPKIAKAMLFETGTNRWRRFDAWPTKDAKQSFFLHADGHVTNTAPKEEGFDEFVSDPAKPVPYINKTVIGMVPEYMTADQRFAATRPDVLVYSSSELTEDLTIGGPIEVTLHVSTTGTDADWIVKVIDVYPDDFPNPDPNPTEVKMGGYQQLVRGDVLRGKFRSSFEKPEPFEPGKPTQIGFTMPDVLHTFRPGHKLMIQVQSTWFPLVDRNPQTFCDIYNAKESDFRKATHRVYHGPTTPSQISVRVLK